MTLRRKTFLGLAGIVVLAVAAVLAVLPADRGGVLTRFFPGFRLGLDLQGGTQLTYEADMQDIPQEKQADALDGVRDVIERRVNAFGVAEPLIQVVRGGKPRVIVELAGVHNVEDAIRQIGETPQLDFREAGETIKATTPEGEEVEIPQWKRTDLTGRHLERADVVFHPQTGQPQVSLLFNGEGKRLFGELTERNVGKQIAIFLDGEPITAPVVQQAITTGEAVITGTFTIEEARELAIRLNAGALPVPISLVSRTTVGPSLGRESLTQSMTAGVLGLSFVAMVMVVLYRLPGLIAALALFLYGLLVFAFFQVLGATLTLAGIAGFILSLGMAVDANVLIFERLKEELRVGKPLTAAVTEGFREAWPSIRDSNVSSLITAALLYAFGSNVVRGFATTLGIGIIVSMFTAITVTRTLLRGAALIPFFRSPRWYARMTLPGTVTTGARVFARVVRANRFWVVVSAALVAVSIAAIAVWGVRPGIDFTGGSLLELRGEGVTVTSVREGLAGIGEESATVQDTGTGSVLVRLRTLSTEEHAAVLSALRSPLSTLEELRFETIGPAIGRELLRKAIIAIALALILILGFLAWSFRKATTLISPWAFGAIAVIALFHDLAVMTGAFAVLARFRGASADSLFLTAALTLLGFSVHDTIVVFNRIKTNLARLRLPFPELAQRSLLETLTRSLNTSATTLLVLLALLFFGGSTTQAFVATLSAGIIVGAYSSIFLASPLLILWQARRSRA